MANAFSVAKELVKLSLSGDEPDPLTNLRLQKLLYYAQAWSLVVRESALFSNDIRAWSYGPVVPDVYHDLPDGQGRNNLPPDVFAEAPSLDADEAEFVKCLWEAYSQYSASRMSKMTHDETPWVKAWGGRPLTEKGNNPISAADLEEHFGQQKPPPSVESYLKKLRDEEENASLRVALLPDLDPARLHAAAVCFSPGARPQPRRS